LKEVETLAFDAQTNVCDNLYLITSQKTNALINKRPACNMCGSVCEFLWYKKKQER